MKHNFFLVVGLIFLNACVKIQKKNEESNQPAQQQTSDFSGKQLKYIYTKEGQLKFLFPPNWPNTLRVVMEGSQKKEFSLDLERNTIPAIACLTSFKFYSQDQLLDEVDVLPPVELTVAGRVFLKEKVNLTTKVKSIFIKRLNLSKESELILEDFSGTLIIENLLAQNATVRTFAEGATSDKNLLSKSGGHVMVEIESGQGEVKFVAQGENGSDGQNGKPADDTLRGQNGDPGKVGEFDARPGGGSSAYDGSPGCIGLFYFCKTPPTYGTTGQPGKRGYPGENGKDGGGSGAFVVNSRSSDLKIDLQVNEANGGKPGLGGTGGLGGQAGVTGDGFINDLNNSLVKKGESCSHFPFAYACIDDVNLKCHVIKERCGPPTGTVPQNGPQGPSGIDGSPGKKGPKEVSCLYQNNQLVQCVN